MKDDHTLFQSFHGLMPSGALLLTLYFLNGPASLLKGIISGKHYLNSTLSNKVSQTPVQTSPSTERDFWSPAQHSVVGLYCRM